MTLNRKQRLLLAVISGIFVFATLFVLSRTPANLLGRLLEGDELLRVQAESDFDRDGNINFLDFTVFSAFYEEA